MIRLLHCSHKIFILFFLILLWFLTTGETYAQSNNCAFKLQEAENLYEMGNFDSIPAMLKTCIDNDNFDDEELSRAYKLLILTYLFEDYQEMADFTMQKFLKKFPEYEVKATDPIEFSYLVKSYKTIPTFSIGIMGGINYSFVRIIEPYSTSNTEDYSGDYSISTLNFQGGVHIRRYITEEIEINLDALFYLRKFNYSNQQLNLYTIDYEESQSLLSFPLTGSYEFKMGTVSPFIRAGFSIDYLLAASSNMTRTYESYVALPEITGPDIDRTEDRQSLNFSGIIGAGLKYRIKKGYLMLDIRYHLGFTNNVNASNRLQNNEMVWKYHYEDDMFSLNNVSLSVGYVYSFYKTVSSNK
ncbi:MAG: porin family protein [Bacteroidales bacterium]